ncbi:hypothetical protein CLTEP_23900 [Clostridium tepidiprofundi DSM 19306]|uniref:Uncharacterized protein n=2 Tax=Clostridium TaxID=1485 RepID=A0A151AUP1_9CLOT|nr:hypothetical protein CLTEP_23900 [Clostridium tepidiprofundi DSM 19306]
MVKESRRFDYIKIMGVEHMAKTIKFNLICDGNPVRTLEDMKNNFSIEDIIKYFNNKLLHRWLTVRGYNEELEKVEKLQNLDSLELVKELIKIFDVETDPTTIAENTYILQYKQERKVLLEEYKKMDFKVSTIIDDYHQGYRELIDTILENKNDIAKIKAAIKEIDRKYSNLYKLNYRNLFYNLFYNAPMAVFVMLMNDNMREEYLPFSTTNEDGTVTKDIDKRDMYGLICNLISKYNQLKEILGDNLKVFSGATDGYWKDVEPKGKKYMILSMRSGNYIRSSGVLGGDLNSDDINKQFLILDGIDYKSNNEHDKLLYMEV